MLTASYKNFDHAPDVEHRTRMKRLLDIFTSTLFGVAVVCALFAVLAFTREIERRTDQQERLQQEELTNLRAHVADAQSWDCKQVKPQHRLTATEYRWCARVINER